MKTSQSRTTVYFTSNVRKALKKRVADSEQTMSEYVNRAVAQAIAEDLEDIEDVESRKNELTETFDSFIDALKADGVI